MNLLKREMRVNLWPFLIWSGVTAALFFIIIVLYPYIINGQNIDELMAAFPEEILKAFNFDLSSVATASGWLASEGLAFYYLIGGLYAAVLGANLILKEENDKTIDYLYSKPISKNYILTNKLLCGVIYITGFTLLVALANIIGLLIIGDLKLNQMILLLLAPWLIFVSCFAIAALISVLMRKTKTATIISCGLVFAAYFIQIISVISDQVEFLKYFTVFTLADSRYILQNIQISPWSFFAFALIVIASTTLTFVRYNRKEFI